MFKKLFPLLTLSIFIAINSAQPPTDAATKIHKILSKMGVISTTSPTGCYTEVSPNAQSVNTYDANHELINSIQVSEYMQNLLNKQNTNKNEKIKAELFLYRLGTRLEIEQAPNKTSKLTDIIKFNMYIIPRILAFKFIPPKILDVLKLDGEGSKKAVAVATQLTTTLLLVNFVDSGYKNFICDWFDRRHKKQDVEELNIKTFHNLGLYADTDYSYLLEKMKSPTLKKASDKRDTDHSFLLEKMQSPLLKKAFEQGIKARKNRSRRS